MKRQRGRNRKPGGGSGGTNANSANPNRSWDSQGPENIKVRGNAQTVYERYQQLGRDATASGDRVLAENYLQHAEHYFRVLRALQPQRPVSEIAARELSNQGYDIDFEDETGAQAAAFLAAQQAADRAAQGQNGQGQNTEGRSDNESQNRDQPRDQNRGDQNRHDSGQREWRDRDNNRDRDRDNRERDGRERDNNRDRDRNEQRAEPADGAPRAEGEDGQGGRRETRRERWERRREERNRRFEAEGGVGEAPDNAAFDPNRDSGSAGGEAVEPAALVGTPYEPAADDVPAPATARVERPRRTRMPREDDNDAPSALPGFLTRSSAPAPAATEAATTGEGETPAPKKRAPRRKAETSSAED